MMGRMSDLELRPTPTVCGGRTGVRAEPVRELSAGRTVPLGESTRVRRLLPGLRRRMVGAWCFVDHYGPDDVEGEAGMRVPPHPHMGLQTVSWLRDGEVLHRDSLGSVQTLRPGTLGLMTAGRGIAHAEQSPREHGPRLHGAQLWIALPDEHRQTAPAWEFHAEPPVVAGPGLRARVLLGELDGAASPGTAFSPLVGADIDLAGGAGARLPVDPDFEYAALTISGQAEVDGLRLDPGSLLYLGCGRAQLALRADVDSSLMLLGGEPFAQEIVMWWNLIGRSGREIAEARRQWTDGERFGAVSGYDGPALRAPELPATPLKPRGRTR